MNTLYAVLNEAKKKPKNYLDQVPNHSPLSTILTYSFIPLLLIQMPKGYMIRLYGMLLGYDVILYHYTSRGVDVAIGDIKSCSQQS